MNKPPDFEQRVANGLMEKLWFLPNCTNIGCCNPASNAPSEQAVFASMCVDSRADPFAHLPVLFSSARSIQMELVDVPPFDTTTTTSYFIAPYYGHSNPFVYAKTAEGKIFNWYSGEWLSQTMASGTPGILTYRRARTVPPMAVRWDTELYIPPNVVAQFGVNQNPILDPALIPPSPPDPVLDLCMSGNGSTVFGSRYKDQANIIYNKWYRSSRNGDWTPLPAPLVASYRLACSFDGTTVCATSTNPNAPVEYFNNDTQVSIPLPLVAEGTKQYPAVLGKVGFVARGTSVFSLWSTGSAKVILSTTSPCTGIWADASVLWVGTAQQAFMSVDAGWTWFLQNDARAVGPGLYIRNNALYKEKANSSFREQVEYPLKLTSQGVLRTTKEIGAGSWKNWFEFYELDDQRPAFLTDDTDQVVYSSNGRYVLVQKNKNVTLYFNLWNSKRFREWCGGDRDTCSLGYLNYCEQSGNEDPGCGCVNRQAEATRLFNMLDQPEATQTSLRSIVPCVSARCQGSLAEAFPLSSVQASCNRNIVLCTSMINNTGTIVGGVDLRTDCGSGQTFSCEETACPVGFSCINRSCQQVCDGTSDCRKEGTTCVRGACLPEADQKDVDPPPNTSGLETWHIALIILGVLAVLGGVAAVFFSRRGPKPSS
jgi:hypothetical protein